MSYIHFLNVLEGDCNIIQHDSDRTTVIDVSNASNETETAAEKRVRTSKEREEMRNRTKVPSNKKDYKQKLTPDNPITYIKDKLKLSSIFRFIITHPDMDHLDGVRDLFDEFQIQNTWDTANNEEKDETNFFAGYNVEDWQFYKRLRGGEIATTKRLELHSGNENDFWIKDYLKILAPLPALVDSANEEGGDIHDLSYAILYTPPKEGGGNWKIVFAGDTHDNSWEHILNNYEAELKKIDVLFAPHHGRDSNRSYKFLETLKPRLTLMGNASSEHLAYNSYPRIRITNNQAGYVILQITQAKISVYVKNYDFARDFKANRGWKEPWKSTSLDAWNLFKFDA
jgi:competence protein ComEC